jgi:uncharacterized protein YjaZ
MEGLAEHAVLDCCGEDYLIKGNRTYSNDEMERIWHHQFEQNIDVRRSESLHDRLLYGQSFSRSMLGYTIGYYLVEKYRKKDKDFTINKSFKTPAEQFLLPNNE